MMNWIFVMGLASIILTLMSVANRYYGFTLKSYFITLFAEMFFIAWMLPLGYKLAPTFFQPYMFTIGALSLGGWLSSVFFFHEVITIYHYMGVLLILIGSALLA